MTTVGVALTILAVALFGAFVLLGAWIDGRRQNVLEFRETAGHHTGRQRRSPGRSGSPQRKVAAAKKRHAFVVRSRPEPCRNVKMYRGA